jgi:hypothetical protein
MSDRPQPPGREPQAVGIVALLVGSVGAAATLVPLLRVPGVLVGLVGAILGIVTLITRG